jgi:hypothetical protein
MYLYLVPNWFYGYDIASEIFFGLVSFFVGWYAWKIYKMSGERGSKMFSASFMFISASYFILAFLNIFIVSQLSEGGFRGLSFSDFSNILVFSTFSLYLNLLFFVTGMGMLAYTTLKTDKSRTIYMILAAAYTAIVLSVNKVTATYVLASIFLAFVVFEYKEHNNKITGALLLAFTLLLIKNIEFLFVQQNYIHYIICHGIELVAYAIILGSLITILKHGEKKKQARNHP